MIVVKDDNGSYGMGTSKGWDINALAFTDALHRAKSEDVDFTQTFSIVDGGKFSLGWQFAGNRETV